jgi:acetyl-CoA carboxylase carboxyl transferase subunit alpha
MPDGMNPGLAFEQPIFDIDAEVAMLEKATQGQPAGASPEAEDALRAKKRERTDLIKRIYSTLTPWQTVQVARHKNRPYTTDYLSLAFTDFVELHGDRRFGDDRALITGFAKLDEFRVMVVGHQKGRTVKERTACYFGCAHPEGYRKAMLRMEMAEKYGLPIICFIDTPGAYPGVGAEERGQSQAIAESMFKMSKLKTPIICVVIGEGGSGGALAIGVGNRVAILEHSYYSVISPEGCAGILWKGGEHAEKAATALRFTARDLLQFEIVDHMIEEPLGGAHRDPHQMASRLKLYLTKTLRELTAQSGDQLVQARYEKFRRMGRFLEEPVSVVQDS